MYILKHLHLKVDVILLVHWEIPFEINTPPVEDLRNIQHRESVNSK